MFFSILEIVTPKQKIRSSKDPSEGCVTCDQGYDYWVIMENPAFLFPRTITVLYKFDLGLSLIGCFTFFFYPYLDQGFHVSEY